MRLGLAVAACTLFGPAVCACLAATEPDPLGEALALGGLERGDLGFRPKGYWLRYPNPAQIAYKLPFFDDLLAEPLRLYDFARTMAMATRNNLGSGGLDSSRQSLYRLAYFLGVDPKISGFRPYGANLPCDTCAAASLERAVERLYDAAGYEFTSSAFGEPVTDRRAELVQQAASLPPHIEPALAKLVVGLVDAYRWRQQALRNCSADNLHRVFAIRNLANAQDDGQPYYFEIDDLSRQLDERCLYYACLKAVQAADDARRAFAAAQTGDGRQRRAVGFELSTPLGRIVVGGTDDDVHTWEDAAIVVDLGGDDRYLGPVGGTSSLQVPIAIVIDCAGNDAYEYTGSAPAQGAGILGAGILLDDGGNDTYRASRHAQGFGQFGLGLLFDRAGHDQYTLELSGQGASYFGLGYLLDATGDDGYYLYGDGQGFGGPGGVGVLADYSGADHYVAEAEAAKAGRPDYHSQDRISYSNAQGVGAGRRGDGSDGHNWGGGLGVLVDLHGDDRYDAGNFSMGAAYMYGTGLLYDGAGDDAYRSVYFTQGSGAHFCLAALIDEDGNDRHELYDTGGAGLGFGWDFAVALLLDRAGNDAYRALNNSFGRADMQSNGLFLELGGDDEYAYPAAQEGLGAAPFRQYSSPSGYPPGPYTTYAGAIGLFVDIGGRDRYPDPAADVARTPASDRWGNDRTWVQPAWGSSVDGHRSCGVGMDVADGVIPEFVVPAPPEPPTSP